MKEVLQEKIKDLTREGQQIIQQKEKILVVLNNYNRRITEIEGAINTLNGMMKPEKPVEEKPVEEKPVEEEKQEEQSEPVEDEVPIDPDENKA